MSSFHLPIRVVLDQDEGSWFAHCLEFGLAGDVGASREALDSMVESIRMQAEFRAEHGNSDNRLCFSEARTLENFASSVDAGPAWASEWPLSPTAFLEIEGVHLRAPSLDSAHA